MFFIWNNVILGEREVTSLNIVYSCSCYGMTFIYKSNKLQLENNIGIICVQIIIYLFLLLLIN
jgi:hypothetical protein